MKNRFTKGFTLIELLVVIAIIGVLASVVLASLNSARTKGSDAAVRANMANARAEAEIWYDNAGVYNGVCSITGTNVIGDNVFAAADASGATYAYASTTNDAANGGASAAVCHDNNNGWAAFAPTDGSPGSGICVDYTGYIGSTTVSVLNTDGDVTCN